MKTLSLSPARRRVGGDVLTRLIAGCVLVRRMMAIITMAALYAVLSIAPVSSETPVSPVPESLKAQFRRPSEYRFLRQTHTPHRRPRLEKLCSLIHG